MAGSCVPQYIFTVRHGARLDAADPNWHLTSATPYDPPLTYGGWLQARSLGQRIASILNTRSASPATSSLNLSDPKPKDTALKSKQTRVVIHTSPFLRCIQTSIAISAGISMSWGQQQQENTDNALPKREYIKPLLRVDAWLGEWLTPDYFTEVSPPPEMPLLAATSKADLMRPSSAHAIRPNPPTNTPQTPLSPLGTFSKDFEITAASVGYTPPAPGYAISPNKPIPRGFVSHAKECIDIDYPWDSTKFGRGGEYGEEWSTMHKRFRKGYKQMLNWFATMGADITAYKTVWGKPGGSKRSNVSDGVKCPNVSSQRDPNVEQQNDTTEEGEFETVLILVTHGAGCNALIGAMTDKPVLMDIGIASMTMAERTDKSSKTIKPPQKTTYSAGVIPPPSLCPVESTELGVSYDVKVMASTEHLRRGSMAAIMNPTAGNSPKLVGRDSPSLGAFRARAISGVGGGSTFGGWSIKERSASVRLMASTTGSTDEEEQAAGSEESDSGKEEHGTWVERKRRWTMDQANRRGPI
ncbi:hypothetical protein EV426DRAFT_633785 [Tirmania nivea]|nr:hypothetical protein EV426DRAFT_633785 [Tirmania nivea]